MATNANISTGSLARTIFVKIPNNFHHGQGILPKRRAYLRKGDFEFLNGGTLAGRACEGNAGLSASVNRNTALSAFQQRATQNIPMNRKQRPKIRSFTLSTDLRNSGHCFCYWAGRPKATRGIRRQSAPTCRHPPTYISTHRVPGWVVPSNCYLSKEKQFLQGKGVSDCVA